MKKVASYLQHFAFGDILRHKNLFLKLAELMQLSVDMNYPMSVRLMKE